MRLLCMLLVIGIIACACTYAEFELSKRAAMLISMFAGAIVASCSIALSLYPQASEVPHD